METATEKEACTVFDVPYIDRTLSGSGPKPKKEKKWRIERKLQFRVIPGIKRRRNWYIIGNKIWRILKSLQYFYLQGIIISIVDPDPVGSKIFSRIRIRKNHSVSWQL
jgi:hypothetical protein